jgi:putative colanic acid biosynthesis acetyltransferase WcaF
MSRDRSFQNNSLRDSASPTIADKLRRAFWYLIQNTFYRYSPVVLHSWRRFLLRRFGAVVASDCRAYPTAKIWAPWNLVLDSRSCLGPRVNCYSVGKIRLGCDSIISQGAYLCGATHDFRDTDFTLIIGDIDVGTGAWIATEAFVGPGVTIGDRAVVGARAVVTKDVEADLIVAGNPARVIGRR